MVGVPRSKGCQTCLNRRTKCDEARPACRNCIKYGAVCPGYDRGLKFVAGKHNVRRRGKRQTEQPSGSSIVYVRRPHPDAGTASTGNKQPVDYIDVGNQYDNTTQIPQPVTALEKLQSAMLRYQTVPNAPRPNTAQFVGTLLETLKHTSPHDESLASGTWISDVASRLDQSPLLETAICAFTQHLLGKVNHDELVVAQSRTPYGCALNYLQQSLNHPQKWRLPETLGASLILCFYELFAGTTTPDSWMQHAKGVTRLIQLRGSAAYVEEWEHSMLLSFRPIIIMNALFSGEDCFLADEPWQSVMRHKPGVPTNTIVGKIISPDGLDVGDRYFQLLARLPGILRHGYALREANARQEPIDIQKALLLAESTQQVHTGFLEWYPRLLSIEPEPTEIPSKDPASIFPHVLHYGSPWMGALYMGYWASMLILQEILIQCRYPVDFRETNSDLAQNILKSIENVGHGVMGAFRCGYSLRIAFEFVDDRQKAWIGMWLGRFERDYAATSAKTYPGMESVKAA
ncbi:hypothetical protein SCAR479_03690 [Seiridium cardinale]|uniref:Zn(2)-C6 fungal-type domain-containing protein n=1 Tax=Seiridium cardinale TaxID=138064 RepID=A0ABR2Y0Q9_9PEZI